MMMSAAQPSTTTNESHYGSPMTGMVDGQDSNGPDDSEDQARYLYAKYTLTSFRSDLQDVVRTHTKTVCEGL